MKLILVLFTLLLQVSICNANPFCASLFVSIPVVEGTTPSIEAATDNDLLRLVMLADTIRYYSVGKWLIGDYLNQSVRLMNEVAARYFAAQGITVRELARSIRLGDGSFLHYSQYELSGKPDGVALSRLLHAMHTKAKFADFPVRVILDPLLEEEIYGYNIGSIVALSPKALTTSRLGTHRVFRHELAHYFQALKIRRGENSLQRLSFERGRNVAELEAYSKKFFIDELEAFFRDLNIGPYAKSGEEIRAQLRADGFFAKTDAFGLTGGDEFLPEAIAATRSDNMQFLDRKFEQSLRAIEDVEQRILKNRGLLGWLNKPVPYEFDGRNVRFNLPDDHAYGVFVVDISGILKVEKPSRRQIENTALEILKWSRTRILRIQELAKQLPPE